MKKLVLIAFVTLISLTANAQEKDQFTKDTEKLVEIIIKPTIAPILKQFESMVAEDKREAFFKDVEATYPEFFTDLAKIYKEEFTHDEIKELLAFYATPIGKKLADKSGVLSQKGMMVGQTWGMKLQGILGKYQ